MRDVSNYPHHLSGRNLQKCKDIFPKTIEHVKGKKLSRRIRKCLSSVIRTLHGVIISWIGTCGGITHHYEITIELIHIILRPFQIFGKYSRCPGVVLGVGLGVGVVIHHKYGGLENAQYNIKRH